MTPTNDGFVQTSQIQLHYEQWRSDGPTVVCLHGTSLNGKVWSWLAGSMHPEFNLIGLDQRGHGDSGIAPLGQYTVDHYCDDLIEFMDAMAWPQVSFVGSSLGTRVALKYASNSCIPFSPTIYRFDVASKVKLKEDFEKVVDAVFFCDLAEYGLIAYQTNPLYECRLHAGQ